jgi:hypothetical protein
VLWFQFFTSEEDKALQQWESFILKTPEDTANAPQNLPEALQWVPQHFNPQQRAVELEADRPRSANILSNASALRSPGGLRSPAALRSPCPWRSPGVLLQER